MTLNTVTDPELLGEMGTEAMRLVARWALVMHMYGRKDSRVLDAFFSPFDRYPQRFTVSAELFNLYA